MILPEYKKYFDQLILHSKKYIETNCKFTGSFQVVMNGKLDPRFLNDYRYYAMTKSTKSLISFCALLEIGHYEDALILTRTMLECYLSQHYFDDKFDMETLMDMVIIPTAIFNGDYVHKDDVVINRKTGEEVAYNHRTPGELSIGKDRGFFL